MTKFKYFLFFLGAMAFGGQSIQLSTATASNNLVPAQSVGANFRVEFSIHDWDPNASTGHPLTINPVGVDVQLQNLGGGILVLQMYTNTITLGPAYVVCQIRISSLPVKFITVRFQEDDANKVDYCQAWDINGNFVNNTSSTYTAQSGANSAGVAVGSTGQNLSTAYFRIYTSLVGTNARPPVTADTTSHCLVFWKFDNGNNTGSLNDSCSAGPYNASMSTGAPVYVSTPGQSLVVPVVKISNAPVWGNTSSLRAGFPSQLDGTTSYSQADASGNVACFWQNLSNTPPLLWDSQSSCSPTVQGQIFGDYKFQLVATDVNNTHVIATQDIGAVATDSNGVVVNADPNVDFLYGSMIAWGQNPWGYQDYWAAHAAALRQADYIAPVVSQSQSYPGWSTLGKPQWEFPGAGTVSYFWNCTGLTGFCNRVGTTLNGSCSATSTSCTVSDVTKIDTSSFPTRVLIYDGANWDEDRICSVSANTLNWCYDPSALPRHTFASGANILQAKVTGSGTHFLTDATSSVCPVGAPGLPGVSVSSMGGITLTAGSTAVTGSGTNFDISMVGDFIQVAATHSGTAFTFMAQISAVADATHITLARVFPSDADTAAGRIFNIMPATRSLVLHYGSLYTDPTYDPNGEGLRGWGTTGCESETAVYLNPIANGLGNSFFAGWDSSLLDGVHETGRQYSVTDTTGWVSQSGCCGGISFYGEGLAHRALYLRSGLAAELATARSIDDYWVRSPWGDANLGGSGTPRLYLGGGAIGAFVAKITDPQSLVGWASLRAYADMGRQMVQGIAANGCNTFDDTRDSGYAYAWLILGAIYDPDTTSTAAPGGISWSAYWRSFLSQMRANDSRCENQHPSSNHSFANSFYFNPGGQALALTNGMAAATGTGIPASLCSGTAMGTAAATNGSNALTILTGTLPTGTVLYLSGTTGGGTAPFSQALAYSISGATATVGVNWLGDSGTVTWISSSVDGFPGDMGVPSAAMTIATDNNDYANLAKNWACIWNNSSLITLNRAWDGPTGNFVAYVANLAGFGQQPFMLGIKSYGENLLATQTVPGLSAYIPAYQNFTANSTGWIWNIGMDHQLFGTSYGRIFQQCEPASTAPSGTAFTFRDAGCTYGADPTAVYLSREQNSETGAAHAIYYQNNANVSTKSLGDQFYGALWGFCPWTTGGVYCDANSTAANQRGSNLSDDSLHGGKWLGFFTGMGMSHRWPATRLGGVQAARPRTVWLSVRMADVAGAASVKVLVTAPSGAQASFACSSQPCAVTVDDRQGAHLYQIQYLSAGGAILSQSQTGLLAIN